MQCAYFTNAINYEKLNFNPLAAKQLNKCLFHRTGLLGLQACTLLPLHAHTYVQRG